MVAIHTLVLLNHHHTKATVHTDVETTDKTAQAASTDLGHTKTTHTTTGVVVAAVASEVDSAAAGGETVGVTTDGRTGASPGSGLIRGGPVAREARPVDTAGPGAT